MSFADKLVSAVKIAAQLTPPSAMLSQWLDEIETGRLKARLDRLEDPLAKYGPRARELMEKLYSTIQAQAHSTTLIEWTPAFQSFRKELRYLEAAGFLEGRHTVTGEFVKGLRLSNAGFIVDLALLFDDLAKSVELNEIIDSSRVRLNGAALRDSLGLPLTVIYAFFQRHEQQGQGRTSATIGESNYTPHDAK